MRQSSEAVTEEEEVGKKEVERMMDRWIDITVAAPRQGN